MENVEVQVDAEKDLSKLRKAEHLGMFLDKFCIWCEAAAMVMCLCAGNWIQAMIWFNCVLWNWRVVKDSKRLKEANLVIAMLSFALYGIKKDEKKASSEVIDVESKEVEQDSKEPEKE